MHRPHPFAAQPGPTPPSGPSEEQAIWTLFQLLSDREAERVIRDCRQAQMGLVDELMERVDVLRSQLPASAIWSRTSRQRIRRAVMRFVADTFDVVDDLFRAPPVSSANLGCQEGEASGRHPHDCLRESWLELYATLLGDDATPTPPMVKEAENVGERWSLFHDGYLSHLETMAHTWATHAVRLDRERFLRADTGRRYEFYREAGIDPLGEGKMVDPDDETRLQALLDQYEKEVRATAGTNPDNLKERRFFHHNLLAEALWYQRSAPSTMGVECRSQNIPWTVRPQELTTSAAGYRKRLDHFMQACFFASHLPAPADRIGLADVVHASGLVPSTMMQVAAGLSPWVVVGVAPGPARSTADWRNAELQLTVHQDEVVQLPEDARWPGMPNTYGRKDRRQHQSFWLQLAETGPSPASAVAWGFAAPTSPPHGGFDRMRGELRSAHLLPSKKRLAAGWSQRVFPQATDFDARLETIAQSLLRPDRSRASLVTRYVEGYGHAKPASPMVKALLSIYLQLPLLHALPTVPEPRSDLDREALRHVLRLVMAYDTLVTALQMLATPAAVELLRTRQKEREALNEEDLIHFHQLVVRFVDGGRRRMPGYLLAGLEAIRDVLHSGAFGIVDFNRDAGAIATVPWLRLETLDMSVLLLRVRLETMRRFFSAYIADWRLEQGLGSIYASGGFRDGVRGLLRGMAHGVGLVGRMIRDIAVGGGASTLPTDEEELARQVQQLIPNWFTMGVAGPVLRLMSGITIGAGLYGSVLAMCGLEVAPQDRAQFCWLQAMRGGLPGRSVVQLVRLASRYADPYLALGLPLIGPGLALDAQIALYRYLVNLGSERRPALLALLRDHPILFEWVQWLMSIVDRWTPSRLPRVDIPFPVELCDELSRPPPKRPMLFLNATFFKYALRAELQRAGGRLWLV